MGTGARPKPEFVQPARRCRVGRGRGNVGRGVNAQNKPNLARSGQGSDGQKMRNKPNSPPTVQRPARPIPRNKANFEQPDRAPGAQSCKTKPILDCELWIGDRSAVARLPRTSQSCKTKPISGSSAGAGGRNVQNEPNLGEDAGASGTERAKQSQFAPNGQAMGSIAPNKPNSRGLSGTDKYFEEKELWQSGLLKTSRKQSQFTAGTRICYHSPKVWVVVCWKRIRLEPVMGD